MQNQPNTTSSSSSTTVDRHGIIWIEDPTSTTLSSSQTSNPIVDNDFLSGSQHFFDIDELLRNLIGQKDLVSREEFKPGETIYLCVRCQLGYHEDSYLYINNRCDQCQTNDKITAYTLPHHLSFDDYYNQGISAFNQKNYEQAINKFTRALSLDPNHADAYVWRSDAYIQLSQYQQAIEDCTQIISIDPDNIPAYVRRGFARLSLEEYQQSLEDSNRAISLISLTFNQTHTNSWLSQAYAQQGDAHQALGNSNEAIENYQKSLDIVPNDDLRAKLDALNNAKNHLFDQYFNQGITLFNKEKYQQAIDKFTRALTLNPNHIQVYGWRRDAYIQLGQYQQAIEDCTQIIRIDPHDIPAYVRRGFAHLSLGEYQQSLEDSNRAISLISLTFNQTHTDSWLSQAYTQRGDAHQALGNTNEAIENYQKALDIAPNDDLQAKLDALQNQVTQSSQVSTKILKFDEFYLDQIVENQENTAQVNKMLKILGEDIPKNIPLDVEIDNFSKKQDDNPFEMEFVFQEILDILLESNELDIDASYDPVKIEVLTDQAHEDIEILFEEADHEISTIDLLQELQLAKEKLQARDYEAAIEKFNLVLNHNPDELEAYYHRGMAYAEVGLYSNAIGDFNTTIGLNKSNAEAYFQRGMIYKNTGDYKQAIRDFDFTLFFKPNHSLAYQNKRQLMNL